MNCSGGPLEGGLRRVISDIRIGSLLVQSDAKTGEPLLLHVMLPCCIRDRERAKEAYVFLLDAQVLSSLSFQITMSHPYLRICTDRHGRSSIHVYSYAP